jgi:GGDEF domain-containing protein
MTQDELNNTLQDAINQHSLKTVMLVLIDISSLASENNPEWGWESDRALLKAIVDHVKN